MHENKKVLFIINKFAGTGYQSSVEGRILSQCHRASLEATIEFTQRPHHATELSRQAAEAREFDIVFAVGGDGTINEVAQGLLHTGQPMGVLPHGSGNGLARHLGIPMNFEKSLQLIDRHRIISMDSFLINEKLSLNVSGIGFDGHIANLFADKTNRGFLGYSRLVLHEFFSFPEFKVEAKIDDAVIRSEIFMITFANSSQFGNNARISPHASVCDGLIDVCFVRKVPVSKAVGFAHQMFTGRLEKSSLVTIRQGKHLTISLPVAMPFHVDGEAVAAAKNFSITVQPASIMMIIPSKSANLI